MHYEVGEGLQASSRDEAKYRSDLQALRGRVEAWQEAGERQGRVRTALFRETPALHVSTEGSDGQCECVPVAGREPRGSRGGAGDDAATGSSEDWWPFGEHNRIANEVLGESVKWVSFYAASEGMHKERHAAHLPLPPPGTPAAPGDCDCSHLCYSPSFWQGVLHNMYQTLRTHDVCDSLELRTIRREIQERWQEEEAERQRPKTMGENVRKEKEKSSPGQIDPASREAQKTPEADEDALFARRIHNPTHCVLIAGFPHSGTSILKSIFSHSLTSRTYPGEIGINTPPTGTNCGCGDGPVGVFKSPFFRNAFLGEAFDRVHKVLIIRHPMQVFDSLNKRFTKEKEIRNEEGERVGTGVFLTRLPEGHSISDWIRYEKAWRRLRTESLRSDVTTIRYEDMFKDDFAELKQLCQKLGIDTHDGDIFNNTGKVNEANNIFGLSRMFSKPTRQDHVRYRAWQVNQPFTNRNRPLDQLKLKGRQQFMLEGIAYPLD